MNLAATLSGATRIYLDNAATSWPKPPAVYQAMDDYQRQNGAPASRGVYSHAEATNRCLEHTRQRLASLIAAPHADQVLFGYSGTDSLNLAIRGLLRPGDHVITSVCDHNAVLRPLRFLEQTGQIRVTRIECDERGRVSAQAVANALRPDTRLLALVHASNVTGTVQPIAEIDQARQGHPAWLLVDAAQTIGHYPVSVPDLGCDLLAAPGHKGLLGPTGTSFLYASAHVLESLQPLRLGGTGTSSDSDDPPQTGTAAFEAGNANVPGLVGLGAGIDFVRDQGVELLQRHEAQLTQLLIARLESLPHITLYGAPRDDLARVGVVSFNVAGFDPQEVAILLDQVAGIQVRAGFHCAPRMHAALQTSQLGGTVRVSLGPFNVPTEIERLIEVLSDLNSA